MTKKKKLVFRERLLDLLAKEYKTKHVGVTREFDDGSVSVGVISKKFEKMGVFKRQDKVWKLIDDEFGRDSINVILVHTLAPSEVDSPEFFLQPFC